jgi:uncharacterized membrane protein HdeD (DUF308 family)
VDDARLSVAVWRPAESWPAEDKAVERYLRLYRARVRNAITGFVVSLVLGVLVSAFQPHFSVVGGLLLLNAVWRAVSGVRHQIRFGRWLPAATSLLNGSPAHRVATRIVAQKGNRAVLAVGPMHLQVLPVTWGVRQVIARTGEITVFGPDPEGHAVVFADGLPVPVPAKVVEAPEPTEAEPIVPVSVNGAEDQVPNWIATRTARLNQVVVVVVLVVLAGIILQAQNAEAMMIYTVIFGAMLLIMAILVAFMPSDQLRLRKLLAAGQWQAHPVTVNASTGDARRLVGGLTLVLNDGRRLSIKLALPELVANISATGTLWMVGLPGDRKGAAVGIPGYPIVTAARFA